MVLNASPPPGTEELALTGEAANMLAKHICWVFLPAPCPLDDNSLLVLLTIGFLCELGGIGEY